ncbi:protease HtpX [Utexia brackfieldae]|uniref:protease HtpX n=1 Tax=Utexia brackfieldae TaxID=3074108 RepID=UPI00370D4FA4
MLRIGLFLLTNLAVMFIFGIVLSLFGIDSQSFTGLLIFAAIFGFAGSIISLLLSKTLALRSVGAKVIAQPSTEQERWLFDVVKRQSDRVGIKMPEVAIYQAPDMNAFATGARRDASLVAVSSGLLTTMTRTEAEAVLAHEVSHIANGDMVTMTLLQGVLNTFVIFISRVLGQVIASALSERNKEMGRGAYFLIVMLLEFVFGILASIIAMWFSRHREFRADAGAAELVGADNMIAALNRLKGSSEPKEEASIAAFCINGGKKSLSELFLSHPPLDKRIEALRSGTYRKRGAGLVE